MAFAIKDAIDLTLKTGNDQAYCVINYLNDCQIQLESEQVFATKKGNNAVSFSSGRSGTLTMNAEVIDDDFLCLMLGATKDASGKITVDDKIPSQAFTATGTFRIVNEDGTEELRNITFYKLQAQVSADLTLSATDVSSFSLVLDILADGSGKIMDITKAVGGASVQDPRIEE